MKKSVLILAALTAGLVAADPKPLDAQGRYEREKKSLDEAYFVELKSIQKTYLSALTGLRKTALESNNIDEAQRLSLVAKEFGEGEPELPSPATKLTTKELAGRRFWFFVVGSGSKNSFALGDDGRVKEYDYENERFWRIAKDGKLTVYTKDMRPSAVYDAVGRSKNGQIFEGRFLLPGTTSHVFLVEQPARK